MKIRFNVQCPTSWGEVVCVVGSIPELGNWDPEKGIVLTCENYPEWTAELELNYDKLCPIEYKFCIINKDNKSVVRWEEGENHLWKCAGLSIPIFSLRTKSSFGIGDFDDLLAMIDWARMTCQKIIQVLPINDTTMTRTWQDSYPYNAISIYALHPLYIHLEQMGKLKNPVRAQFFQEKQKELNKSDIVDYEQVDQIKWRFFQEIFEQEGDETLSSQAFQFFFEENKEWLIPYAAFSSLRDKNQLPENIYYFLQFHAHQQLTRARSYACQQGIVLKGDVPIGISRESVEAWKEPNYFNMQFQAGAPPDDFSITGQNWGFPTYNWEAMENDNYSWWKKRFQKMSDYFGVYRIDHILGFFRIWQIPNDSIEGLLGFFNPALPFSIEEIKNVGLQFQNIKFTKAHINEQFIVELFGENYAAEVKQVYLERVNATHFSLKAQYNAQKKIQDYFSDKEKNEKNSILKVGLFAICNEVLFIEDPEKKNCYHPRISASSSFVYKELNDSDRNAFDYLYWDYFYQRHNEFWKGQALKHLTPLVNSTNMLVCGEDLGMIPHSVPEVMHALQILSLEIERMPKSPEREFTDLHHVPYLSVCTTSTHDMTTIRGWWEENRDKTQHYYNEVLKKEGIAPLECSPEICEEIIKNHLSAQSMLTIIPFQDWLSINDQLRNKDFDCERINIPANSRYYWKYRMHLTIEELIDAEGLNKKISDLIIASCRFH
jgi:4-alpha-glucanotransferase